LAICPDLYVCVRHRAALVAWTFAAAASLHGSSYKIVCVRLGPRSTRKLCGTTANKMLRDTSMDIVSKRASSDTKYTAPTTGSVYV